MRLVFIIMNKPENPNVIYTNDIGEKDLEGRDLRTSPGAAIPRDFTVGN